MGMEPSPQDIDFYTYPQQATNTMTGSWKVSGGVAGTPLTVYMCPSDILPIMSTHSEGNYWGPFAKTNYCGSIGTSPSVSGLVYMCGGPETNEGTLQNSVWNGMLTLSNQNFINYCARIADVTDGTSNTAFVGEVTASMSVSPTNLSSAVFPAWAGGPGNNPGVISLTAADGNQGVACGELQAIGSVFRFMDADYPLNTPSTVATSDNSFASMHTGGANFLFADGSVHFVTNAVSAATYQALGTRNGGDVVINPGW
jgi:prepilin-type processing-associated H-X9-DG protein